MSITNITELRYALAKAQHIDFQIIKTLNFASVMEWYYAPNYNPSSNPNQVTNPGTSGIVPTKDTAGYLGFSNYGGNTNYVLSAEVSINNTSHSNDRLSPRYLALYDTLFINGGLSGFATGVNPLTCVAVDRPDASGTNNELWLLVWSGLTNTTSTITVSYLNQDDVTSETTLLKSDSIPAGRLVRLPLAAGDNGVRQILSYGWSPALSQAGNFGFVIARKVTDFHVSRCTKNVFDWYHLGMPSFYDNAALNFWWIGGGEAGVTTGKLLIGNG